MVFPLWAPSHFQKSKNPKIPFYDEFYALGRISFAQTNLPLHAQTQAAVAVPPPGEPPLNNPSTSAPSSAPAAAPETRDDDVQDEDEDEVPPEFPTTHEARLKDHTKVISALSLDPSGARFATGSHDYDVKLWDFGGMGGGVGKPFKSFEPAESYYVSYRTLLLFAQINLAQVNQLRYNWYGTQFLCISATMQPKLYDRDGEEMCVPQFCAK